MRNENSDSFTELVIEATTENLPQVLDFIEQALSDSDCPLKTLMQINLAAEEIFVNIASYAYAPDTGQATVRVQRLPDAAEIVFIDSGIPYDPLKKPDPDITLSAEERAVGGLGIFLTKKFMDEVSYEYLDGENILTIKKSISE